MKKIVPNDVVLIPSSAKKVFEGVIYDVFQWQQEMFDGSHEVFEMLKRADTVRTICIDKAQILVVHEEQPRSESRVSLPGGRVDLSDKSILSAAQRELREETGLQFQQWRLVDVQQPYVKIEWFIYTFLAWDKTSDALETVLDPGEKMLPKWTDYNQVKQMAEADVRFIGEARNVFKKADNLDQLLALPEFEGREIG